MPVRATAPTCTGRGSWTSDVFTKVWEISPFMAISGTECVTLSLGPVLTLEATNSDGYDVIKISAPMIRVNFSLCAHAVRVGLAPCPGRTCRSNPWTQVMAHSCTQLISDVTVITPSRPIL